MRFENGRPIVTSFGQNRNTGNFIYDLTDPTAPEPGDPSNLVNDLRTLYEDQPIPIYRAEFTFD